MAEWATFPFLWDPRSPSKYESSRTVLVFLNARAVCSTAGRHHYSNFDAFMTQTFLVLSAPARKSQGKLQS